MVTSVVVSALECLYVKPQSHIINSTCTWISAGWYVNSVRHSFLCNNIILIIYQNAELRMYKECNVFKTFRTKSCGILKFSWQTVYKSSGCQQYRHCIIIKNWSLKINQFVEVLVLVILNNISRLFNEPRHEKTCLRCLRPVKTQTRSATETREILNTETRGVILSSRRTHAENYQYYNTGIRNPTQHKVAKATIYASSLSAVKVNRR